MLNENDVLILDKIVEHCDWVTETISNVTMDNFWIDRDKQDIVLFNIFQVGEYAKRLSVELINKYNEIDWKNIKGMRDIIGHCYDSIDYEIVWDSANNDIPKIHDYVSKIIQENQTN